MTSYHQQTKHSYYSVRSHPNQMDWNEQPSHFKYYDDSYKKIDINLEVKSHKLIYEVCGLTAKKTYPGVEYFLRVNPSAGALYPNELYFQARNIDGIDNGIYHYENSTNKLTLLKTIENYGVEKYLNYENQVDGLIFLISSVYYRSSWKYKNRAFRYCLLDAGHIIGAIEASSYINEEEYLIKYDIQKEKLNELFGFNNEELFTTSVVVGKESSLKVEESTFKIPYKNATNYFEKNSLIEEAYKDSILIDNAKAQDNKPKFNYLKAKYEEVILNRRSIRDFSEQPILKDEFLKVMEILNEPITSDCDEEISIYYVINRVKGMHLGLFKDKSYIKHGDFKQKAGYLCLEQKLGMQSAVTFFITTSSKNYQESYIKAGIIGHRLYLIANYLGYGCTGIGAYYDDEVSEFIDEDSSVLYALAIGN